MTSSHQSSTLLIFPHQLFTEHPGLAASPSRVYLIEDNLFFGDSAYPASFHKQKLWLHRASMKRYEIRLRNEGHTVTYVDHTSGDSTLRRLFEEIIKESTDQLLVAEVHDFLLEKRLKRHCALYSKDLHTSECDY